MASRFTVFEWRALVAAVAVVAFGEPARAQRSTDASRIPLSQRAEIVQMVADAEIRIVYRRPVARGRTVFGGVVPFGRVWTPSADSAARIAFSRDVVIGGQALPAGSYALWTIPDSTRWTIIFSKHASAYHLRPPRDWDVALRLTAVPGVGEHTETLTLAFPVVDADRAILQLRWGTLVVPIALRVPSRD